MTDQIEMWWECSACGALNGGLSKRCGERIIRNGKVSVSGGGCGHPLNHTNWIMPNDISSKANLTDPDQIAQAQEGADWQCEYCGSNQRDSTGNCLSCGGNKSRKARKREAKRVSSIPERFDYDMYSNTYYEPKPKNKRVPNWVIGIIIAGIALISLIVWLLMPKYTEAKVKSTSWNSTVSVERFKRIHDDGWYAPGDAENVTYEGRRIHHYDRIQTGSHRECHSVSIPRTCTSNSNGTASCTGGGTRQECQTVNDYRSEPRYRSWYSWYVWRWKHQRNVHATNSDLNPQPPSVRNIALNTHCSGREKERQSNPSYEYKCWFVDTDDKSFEYEPSTLMEYKKCTLGHPATLKITMGTVSVEEWH